LEFDQFKNCKTIGDLIKRQLSVNKIQKNIINTDNINLNSILIHSQLKQMNWSIDGVKYLVLENEPVTLHEQDGKYIYALKFKFLTFNENENDISISWCENNYSFLEGNFWYNFEDDLENNYVRDEDGDRIYDSNGDYVEIPNENNRFELSEDATSSEYELAIIVDEINKRCFQTKVVGNSAKPYYNGLDKYEDGRYYCVSSYYDNYAGQYTYAFFHNIFLNDSKNDFKNYG
jgi:hypothetical protein